MEQDQNFDASLTAFHAPPTADPATGPPAYASGSEYASGSAYDDAELDWETPKVRDSVVWGFRAFAAFAGLVFLMFLGQLLSDDGESSNPSSTPPVSAPAGSDGAPVQSDGSAGLSDDGF